MQPRFSSLRILALLAVISAMASCAPKATPPSVDAVATAVAQAAFDLLTETAAAASPTPTPTLTPTPADTETVTPTSENFGRLPQTVNFAACWLGGPGPTYPLDSHLLQGKGLELLGVGNVPGWYIIRHPRFHNPCWIQAADLKIFPGTDLSSYPVMTPGAPLMGH